MIGPECDNNQTKLLTHLWDEFSSFFSPLNFLHCSPSLFFLLSIISKWFSGISSSSKAFKIFWTLVNRIWSRRKRNRKIRRKQKSTWSSLTRTCWNFLSMGVFRASADIYCSITTYHQSRTLSLYITCQNHWNLYNFNHMVVQYIPINRLDITNVFNDHQVHQLHRM